MFIHTLALAAIATMATSIAACKSITFKIHTDKDFALFWSTLEVNSYYSGYTWPDKFGVWSDSDDRRGTFYSYQLVSYGSASDEFWLRLLILDSEKEYRFTGANKRPDNWTWEYWHCVDVEFAHSSRTNRPRNSTMSGPQRQKPPKAFSTPRLRNTTFLID